MVKVENHGHTNPLAGSFRVEELSNAANISVDTIRFYQTRGLLNPPSRSGRQALYDESHLRRLTEIRELQKSGLSLNTIRKLFAKEVQEADRALLEALTNQYKDHVNKIYLTIDELSDKTSLPKPLLQSLVNEGLIPPIRVNGSEVFPASDAEMARAGLALLESGIPLSELLLLAKQHHQSMIKSAMTSIELFDRYVRDPIQQGDLHARVGTHLVENFNRLLPAAVALVAGHFERTLLALAQKHLEDSGQDGEIEAIRISVTKDGPEQ